MRDLPPAAADPRADALDRAAAPPQCEPEPARAPEPAAAARQRDPEPGPDPDGLARAQATLDGGRDLWVFGYASLIWRPEFAADEARGATVHGWHRALRMRSRAHRGTPERPGLVFALLAGGSCRGVAYRVAHRRARDELARLWRREMVSSVYEPRWLSCRTAEGPLQALAFTLPANHAQLAGEMSEIELVDVLRHARGHFGSTLDYLLATEHALRGCGIRDRRIERLVALARRHRLGDGDGAGRGAAEGAAGVAGEGERVGAADGARDGAAATV